MSGIFVIAKMFPVVSLTLGFLAVMADIAVGWVFVVIGVLFQGAWLATKFM